MATISTKVKNNSESTDQTCSVCFKEAEIFSIGLCDHPICHECSTRMRVLCKEDACPICRREMPKVAFVKLVKPFQQLSFASYLVGKIAKIYFEDSTVQAAFDNLLVHSCHVCPSKLTLPTQQALKDHLRKEHELFFCDLCVDNLKIFSWERKAYTRQELARHRRKGDPDNTSHRGHPLCNFCDQRYVDGDELFRHLRRDHFFCHFCDADGLNQYYCTYEDLRDHFREEHFLCEEGECREEKFTRVFRTDIDFKAHQAQAHKQSLGKAAAKQARTLELEFTVSRRTDNKPKSGRRQQETSNASERGATAVSNGRENLVTGNGSSVEGTTADLDNPQEFPSLSSGQEAVARGTKPANRNDSLAQKLAKGYRFNVRNTDGVEDEEFPSLAPTQGLRQQETAVAAPGRSQNQSNGPQRSIQVKVTSSGASADSSSTKSGKPGPNVSVQATPMPLPQGAGPPVPRITKVSSSQNIKIKSSLPLQRDSDFPSLVPKGPQPQEWPKLDTTWGKKDQPKPSKAAIAKQPPSKPKLNIQAQDEYPSLVPSGKPKSEPPRKALTKARQAPEQKPKPQGPLSIVPDGGESFKGKGKKKKANSKSADDEDTVVFKTTAERKMAELQLGEIKSLSSRMGSTTLDLGAAACTSERKNVAESKIGLIKADDLNPLEANGVKPKVKAKPSFSTFEFPALSSAPQVTQSFFEDAFNVPSSQSLCKTNQAKKANATKNEAGPSSSPTAHTFVPPHDFSNRNHQLISTVADLLCSNHNKISQFRTVSSQFRNGKMEAKQYYSNCMDIMGEDCFLAVLPELLCLLPDIEKQQQLLKVHRSELRTKKASQSTEPFVVCATCNQVLAPCDLKLHLSSHTLENHFPVLSTSEANSAWNQH